MTQPIELGKSKKSLPIAGAKPVLDIDAELKRFDPAALNTQDRISRNVMLDRLELTMQQNALYGDLPFSEDDDWLPVSSMSS